MSIENIQDTETKVLGLRWNAKDDVLKLTEERSNTLTTVGKVNKERDITGSSKIYDHLPYPTYE